MLKIPILHKPTLSEFLEIEFNKGIYNFYHKHLKPIYNIEIESIRDFLFSVYEDVIVFIDNYEKMPYESDEYLKQKIEAIKGNESVLGAIKFNLVYNILFTTTGNINRNADGKLEFTDPYYFANYKWNFIYSLHEQLESKAEKQLNIIDFGCNVIEKLYRYTDQTLKSTNEVLKFQSFVNSLKIIDKQENTEVTPLVDLSNSKGTEKIIMLQQLGILDFLKNKQPFIQSTNKLAEAISGFTGIDSRTVQSYINPMNDNTSIQKNNPMTKPKTVSKVNQKLISIGYIPPQ